VDETVGHASDTDDVGTVVIEVDGNELEVVEDGVVTEVVEDGSVVVVVSSDRQPRRGTG
jgi:hypothetical protein